jgi:outer membrane protein W
MMRHLGVFAVGACALLFSSASMADEEEEAESSSDIEQSGPADKPAAAQESAAAEVSTEDPGFLGKLHLAARLGYGFPLGVAQGEGDGAEALAMNDTVSGMVPIWLDVGYFVTPKIMVGLYAQFGFAFVSDCPSSFSCSSNDIRFGIQGQYHLSRGEKLNPWAGVGIGYEIFNLSAEAGSVERSFSYKGFEFINLQGGADYQLTDKIGVGPFLSFSVGQYSSVSGETLVGDFDTDVENKGLHSWLVIGARGVFGL